MANSLQRQEWRTSAGPRNRFYPVYLWVVLKAREQYSKFDKCWLSHSQLASCISWHRVLVICPQITHLKWKVCMILFRLAIWKVLQIDVLKNYQLGLLSMFFVDYGLCVYGLLCVSPENSTITDTNVRQDLCEYKFCHLEHQKWQCSVSWKFSKVYLWIH